MGLISSIKSGIESIFGIDDDTSLNKTSKTSTKSSKTALNEDEYVECAALDDDELSQEDEEDKIEVTEEELQLIKQELENAVNEMKDDLEAEQKTMGVLGEIGNGIKELFGGGISQTESKINDFEELLSELNGDNAAEIYETIMGTSINQDIIDSVKESNQTVEQLDETTSNAIVELLNGVVADYEAQLNSTQENNGIIAKGWDKFKNWSGMGASSNKAQAEIDSLYSKIDELKEEIANGDNSNLASVYKSVTGNELTEEELLNLSTGEVDFSGSDVANSVTKYQNGQKAAVNTISSVASGLAVVGSLALAPVTGGASLALAFGIGFGAYMLPQAVDGLTEKDGYSGKEIIEDAATGAISSAASVAGMGAGQAVGNVLAKSAATQAGTKLAGLAASEATSVIIGDGMAVGEYLVDVALDENKEFSAQELGITAVSATAASLAAGAAGYGVSSTLRPLLTSGSTAQSQIAGRLITGAVTGGTAGSTAAAVSGSSAYLLSCAVNDEEVSFDEWVNAATENIAAGAVTGICAGVAFEAVQIAAGTPKPEGTSKIESYTDDETGVKYKDYYDKNGNLITRDIDANGIKTRLNSNQNSTTESSNTNELTLYDENTGGQTEFSAEIPDNARTIRVSYEYNKAIDAETGKIVSTAEAKSATITAYDWADNVMGAALKINNNNTVRNAAQEVYNTTGEFSGDYILVDEGGNLIENTVSTAENTSSVVQSALSNAQGAEIQIVTLAPELQNVSALSNVAGQEAANSLTAGIISAKSAAGAGIYTASSSAANTNAAEISNAAAGISNTGINRTANALQNETSPAAFTLNSTENNGAAKVSAFIPQSAALNNIENTAGEILQTAQTAEQTENTAAKSAQYQKTLEDAGMDDWDAEYISTLDGMTEEKINALATLKQDGFSDWQISDLAKGTMEQINECKELIKDYGVSAYTAIDIVNDCTPNQINVCKELIKDYGVGEYSVKDIVNDCTPEQLISLKNFCSSFNENNVSYQKSYDCAELQNNAGSQHKLNVSYQTKDGTKIDVTQIINPDGAASIERTETYSDGTLKSWYINGDGVFDNVNEAIPVMGVSIDNLKSQIEYVYDENKEVASIIYTKQSSILDGAYEKTQYNLSDYPEDYDVLAAIKNGTIENGTKLCNVIQNEDGSITYTENIESNGSIIKRAYTKNADQTGYNYSFSITDENGKEILNTNSSFIKNSDNQTTTIIDGTEYTAVFDDNTMTIELSQANGETATIDMGKITNNDKTLWNTAKEMNARLLAQINECSDWFESTNDLTSFSLAVTDIQQISENKLQYTIPLTGMSVVQTYDEGLGVFNLEITQNGNSFSTALVYDSSTGKLFSGMEFQLGLTLDELKQTPLLIAPDVLMMVQMDETQTASFFQNIIEDAQKGTANSILTGTNTAIIAHELGHINDALMGGLNSDKTLISIYQEEIKAFNEKYTLSAGQQYIQYFGQSGGSGGNGLSEIIAETNTLLNTYGYNMSETSARAQFLVQNFPKTISYIIEKMGY